MQPYTWPDREPLNTPLTKLPVVSEGQIRAFLAAADALLAAAGAVLIVQPKAPPRGAHVNDHAASNANGSAASDGSFFKQVNRAALDNLARWVPRLFPRAALQQTGAYRVNSTDLGRDFEEDLSIHPDGVRDFGPRVGLSPCDVVMEWGGAPNVQVAASTLCEWLGRDPAEFGWNATPHKPNGDARTSERPNGEAATFFDPWAELRPPAFPIDALPPVLKAFAEDRARIIGADPCALAWAAISAASAALDGSIRLKMKRHDTWTVPPAIWVALIGRPSTKKSPIIDAAWEPLQRAQKIDIDQWRQQVANWKALPKDKRDPEEPKPKRRLVSHDGTMEALQDILGRQNRGIGVLRDELAGWLAQLEKYGGAKASGADRAFFLQAFNGGPSVIDRVVRGLTAVDNLLVTICGGIQPDRLRQFADLTDDGLWQRFVTIIVAPATRGRDERPGRAVADYADAINRMLAVPGATRVELDDGAHTVRAEVERRVFDLEQSDVLGARFASFCGKLVGIWGRLCLVLNYLDPDDTQSVIPQRTAKRAMTLLFQSIIPCAARVYAATGGAGADIEATRSVASYILTKRKARVLASELARDVRVCRGEPLDQIQRVLSPLVAGGWLTPERDYNPSLWNVASDVHEQFAARAEREKVRRSAMREVITGQRADGEEPE